MKNSWMLLPLCTLLALVGCGEGTTTSSAPAQTIPPMPANTTTAFEINNQSTHKFSSVAIQTATGTELYRKEFDCAAQQQRCMLYYSGAEIRQPVSLVFYDQNGRMVSAFPFAKAPGKYFDVYTSDWATGFYLKQKMLKKNQDAKATGELALEGRIANFFGSDDIYQQIGAYYNTKLAQSGLTEDQFLTDFNQALQDGKTQIKVAKSNASGPKVSTSGPGCPEGLAGFMGYFGKVGDLIPLYGKGLSIANGLASEYCSGTGAALASMQSKLAELQLTVKEIDTNVANMVEFVSLQEIKTKNTAYINAEANVRAAYGAYKKFLATSGKTSLEDYFNDYGFTAKGWENAFKSNPDDLRNILKGPKVKAKGDTWGAYVDDLKSLNEENQLSKYIDALNLACANPTQGRFTARIQCNLSINTNFAAQLTAQGSARIMVEDIYKVLHKYEGFKNASGKALTDGYYSIDTGEMDTYENTAKRLEEYFLKNDKSRIAKFEALVKSTSTAGSDIKGYYEVLNGLDPTFRETIARAGCAAPGDATKKVPYITNWVHAENAPQRYIETMCHDGDGLTNLVKGRYYYDGYKINGKAAKYDDPYNVVNVMGVLVPKQYVTADCTNRGWWYATHDGTNRDWTYKPDSLTLISPSDRDSNGFLVVNSAGCTGKAPIVARVYGPKGNNGVFAPWEYSKNLRVRGFKALFNSQGPNWAWNWVRVQGADGVNHAFLMQIGGTSYNNVILACVTNDCERGPSMGIGLSSHNIQFAGTAFDFDSYDKSVPGASRSEFSLHSVTR